MPTAAPLLHRLLPLLQRLPLHSFAILRTGRLPTGLFRPRRPRPTPSPRPRPQPLQRRPAAPSKPQPSSPTRPKIRPKLSLAGPPPLGAGRREIAPPSPPPKSDHSQPPPAAPLRTPSPPPNTHHTTPHPRIRRFSPSQPHPKTPPKTTPPHLKSFLEETLTARETPISTPPTTRPIRALHAQNSRSTLAPRRPLSPLLRSHFSALSPLPFRLHPPPQPDILSPPSVWAVICGGPTRL